MLFLVLVHSLWTYSVLLQLCVNDHSIHEAVETIMLCNFNLCCLVLVGCLRGFLTVGVPLLKINSLDIWVCTVATSLSMAPCLHSRPYLILYVMQGLPQLSVNIQLLCDGH